MPIRPISLFAKRISYQSTCVKIRTTFSAVVSVSRETTVENHLRGTSKSSCLTDLESSGDLDVKYYCVSSNSLSFEKGSDHRMPIVAAVVAHRRFYPAATTLASTSAGSQRSSCAARFNALNILVQPKGPSSLAAPNSGVHVRKPSNKLTPGGGTFTGTGSSKPTPPSRPLLELKQLGGFLNGNGKGTILAESRRHYAKGRDKPKSSKSQIIVDENEMGEVIDVGKFKGKLSQVIEKMKHEYMTQLNVRGASGALESLEVEFEGEKYPLQELAQVGRKNPQLAVLNLASLPDAIKPVLKAIEDSGMNLNPQQEGTTIYVPLPKVTREHRENLAKNAKALFVTYKTEMQAIQNKLTKQCKSQPGLSEDLLFRVQQQIKRMTDSYIAEAEKLMQLKQKELLEN